MTDSVDIIATQNVIEVTAPASNIVEISAPAPVNLSTASVLYASYTGQTDFNALTISGSPVATQTYTNSQIAVHNADTTSVHGITDTSVPERLRWNDTDGTLEFVLKGGNVTLQIGQEFVIRVVNKTGADLLESQYKAVRVSSAQGQRLSVMLAQASGDPTSTDTIGLVTENILKNQEGYVTTSGIINDINATGDLQGESWTDGDVLYLSPYTAGAITNIKPQAPSHLIVIGYVIYAHQTQGKVFVKVDNGYEIDELHNVKINGVSNNDLLTYNSTSAVWQNVPMSSASVSYAASTGQTNFNALSISGSSVATQSYVLANIPQTSASSTYASSAGYANNAGNATTTSQTNFTSLNVQSSASINGGMTVRPSSSANVGMIVQGTASQTSDLQQWQNFSGSIVAEVDYRGGATFTSASVGGQSLTPAQVSANLYLAYNYV